MGTTTLVRSLKNKRILFGVAFSCIMSVMLVNFINMDLPGGFLILLCTMYLFCEMVQEDALHQTVDLRLMAVLAIGFFICSRYTVQDYLFTLVVYAVLFRLFFIGANLYGTLLHMSVQRKDVKIPFLPSLALGVVAMGIILSVFQDEASILWLFSDLLSASIHQLSLAARGLVLLCLMAALVPLEVIYWLLRKKRTPLIVFGMGDALILPNFAAFLGGAFFLLAFAGAAICSLGYGIYLDSKKYLEVEE